MAHPRPALLLSAFILVACNMMATATALPATPTVIPTVTTIPSVVPTGKHYYVDGSSGSDASPGTQTQPWQTVEKAVHTGEAGDIIYVRGGEYLTILGGWNFENSGTKSQPITLTNYPGEQAIFRINQVSNTNYSAFRCERASSEPPNWQTADARYIRVIGTDVQPRELSNGVVSQRGIVIQGLQGEQSAGILAWGGCSYWEVAGVDFVETADAIFTIKGDASPNGWYVHHNRVYNYYRESGMQFNGSNNTIVNNEIYKVSDELDTPYGCQMLNLLGHGNQVSGNTISRLGSTATCIGILFEWDLADQNTVEQNTISDVLEGIGFAGGDNNVIRNNTISATSGTDKIGILITSYDNQTTWPCNDTPITDPTNEDYPFLSKPHNCHSQGNQIYNNTLIGFSQGIAMYPVVDMSNIIYDNVIR